MPNHAGTVLPLGALMLIIARWRWLVRGLALTAALIAALALAGYADRAWSASVMQQQAAEDGGDAVALASAQAVIAHQLDAFARGDGQAAFAHAAPKIKAQFGSVDAFMTMVINGYAPIYRHKGYRFGRHVFSADGSIEQVVILSGEGGRTHEAAYSVIRSTDGSWAIDGVLLRRQPGTDL